MRPENIPIPEAMAAVFPAFYVEGGEGGGMLMVRCSRGCKGGWRLIRWPLSVGLRTSLGSHLAWHVRRGDA